MRRRCLLLRHCRVRCLLITLSAMSSLLLLLYWLLAPVYFLCLICRVCLVGRDQLDEPNRQDRPDEPDNPLSLQAAACGFYPQLITMASGFPAGIQIWKGPRPMTPAALIRTGTGGSPGRAAGRQRREGASLCSTRRGPRHRGVDRAAPFPTMAWGCDGTSPAHSAGRILPSSYPSGSRAIEYPGNPSARNPFHDRPRRRRETHHRPSPQPHFRECATITTRLLEKSASIIGRLRDISSIEKAPA